MKRIVYLILVVTMLVMFIVSLSSVGCTAEQEAAKQETAEQEAAKQETAEQEGERPKVLYMWGGYDDPFITAHMDSFYETMEAAGVEVVTFDPGWDVSTMNTMISDGIAMEVDLIAFCPLDSEAVIPVVKQAHEKGVGVMPIIQGLGPDADEYIIGYSGVDPYSQSLVAMEIISEALNGDGKLAIVDGIAGWESSVQYKKAREDYIEEHNLDIEIVGSQPTDLSIEEATKVTDDFLMRFSDLDAIFAFDDFLAGGVVIALKEAGKEPGDIAVVGVNGTQEALDYIKEGWMYGTVHQNPIDEAKFEANRCLEYLETREKLEPFYDYYDCPAITVDNVEEFEAVF